MILLAGMLMHLAAASCVKMEELDIQDSDAIVFTASLYSADNPDVKSFGSHISSVTEDWDIEDATKGSISTKLEGQAMVIGLTSESGDISGVTPWSRLTDAEFSFNGDELKSDPPIRWGTIPSNHKNIKLHIYSPVPTDQKPIKGAVFSDEHTVGAPYFDYTLPKDISNHVDIITAYKEVGEASFGQSVPLTFNHAFTALRFRMGFEAKVKSITISGVYNQARYTIGAGWTGFGYADINTDGTVTSGTKDDSSYSIHFGENGAGKTFKVDEEMMGEEVMMMIPQTLPFGEQDSPVLSVAYVGTDGTDKTIKASLKGLTWTEGRLITYTIHEKSTLDYIYFDLNAGNVTIDATNYTGYVFKTTVDSEGNKSTITETVTGKHSSANNYYVYQSTSKNKSETGRIGDNFKLPSYSPAYVKQGNNEILWTDFITNNKWVSKVIKAWDNKEGNAGAAKNVGRTYTKKRIHVSGAVGNCDLYIDNIYSRYTEQSTGRSTGSIGFVPSNSGKNKLHINMIGDNRLSCIHYNNPTSGNELIIQGEGSLTVAVADYNCNQTNSKDYNGETVDSDTTFFSNHWNSAIGNNDGNQETYGIIINSGVLFAGTSKAENCTAIGGGGNGIGTVTINGGVVTAVATTTGTAIGGGIGFTSNGGAGVVNINGGNVYAYNHANRWGIPSSAIGGAGSNKSSGAQGTVTINGGNVYAESALGTAIGGGSSATEPGGSATVNIYGGYVVAKSLANSPGIGGGSSRTNAAASGSGGDATITIGGKNLNPIVRTGSIGGGSCGNDGTGQIGAAKVTIKDGDIQAQFVMASSPGNNFTMSGGTIRNSYHTDTEYRHIQENGGAVYMEQGSFKMTGGDIKNCTGVNGGAVYIKGDESTTFTMEGGAILHSTADQNGGALYLEGGTVTLKGGSIKENLAAKGNGGGICIKRGSFYMPEGGKAVIQNNAAYSRNTDGNGSGGGVYVTSSTEAVTVNIISGEIKNNTSDRYGGGLSVDMSGSQNVTANVTVGKEGSSTMTNPLITGNRASLEGGGLYVNGALANIVINDGKIQGNMTAGYVANADVANEGGMVTLKGGDVPHVVVTYMPNGGTINLGGQAVRSVTQNIVTATNSTMVVPGTFTRPGWKITSWHTRPDGDDTKGKRHTPKDLNNPMTGVTLNLSKSVTLYAQWTETTSSGQ